MIPPLNEMVGLPSATSPVELDCACEQCFQTLLKRAAHGEANAQDELVRLRVAYLNWAYSSAALCAMRNNQVWNCASGRQPGRA